MGHSLNRRRFLAWSGVAAGSAALVGGGALVVANNLTLPQLLDAAGRTPLDAADGVLVVVTLYGGNDGLSAVVPAEEAAYQQARPELAYEAEETLPLSEGLGLNPKLAGMKGLWDAGRLGIVRGVGYPKPDRSHFSSMAIWQTASPGGPVPTGWLGRWLDVTGGDPVTALSMDPVMPPLLAGANASASALASAPVGRSGAELGEALAKLALPPVEGELEQAVADSYRDMLMAERTFGPSLNLSESDEAPAEGAKLTRQLSQVATLVEAGVPTRVYSVSMGGFDTHADARGTQEALLEQLDTALTSFQQRLDRSARGRQVTTLIYSEFGRRVMANAGDGTDHGTAGPMFVLGHRVTGGFVGEQPSLTDLVDGDLRSTVDFRDVYATMLERVLGTEAGPVLDGWSGRVDSLMK